MIQKRITITDERLTDLKRYMISSEEVIFSYLFGSHAKNRSTFLSDVDIAVYLTEMKFSKKRLEIIGGLIEVLKTDGFDLVILNTAPLPLKIRVIQNKRILTDKKPSLRHAFESHMIRLYLDFSKLEKRILGRRYYLKYT